MSALHSPIGCNIVSFASFEFQQNKISHWRQRQVLSEAINSLNLIVCLEKLCAGASSCSLLTAHSSKRQVCFCQLWCSLSPLINYLSSQSLHLAPASISFINSLHQSLTRYRLSTSLVAACGVGKLFCRLQQQLALDRNTANSIGASSRTILKYLDFWRSVFMFCHGWQCSHLFRFCILYCGKIQQGIKWHRLQSWEMWCVLDKEIQQWPPDHVLDQVLGS